MNSEYKLTVGLEIHAELKTRTKMFCRCLNNPDEKEPNVNVCPICMGHPGTLPYINKAAVKHVLKVGVSVDGHLADFSEFDRKNYFYPDIPKGYQISQYKYPLVSGGKVKDVELTRIHLEEDTAKSSHEGGDGSLVDFNRAGLPLMELVTEPVIHSAKQAGDFARELQLLLRTLGIAEANMEKGEMRVEANISVSKEEGKFGTKVEVKNLNSFRAVERAIDFEVARHIELLEKGEKIIQETRGWDENKQSTFSQRQKEDSHDYRYFPDPDLPKLKLSEVPEFSHDVLKADLPELPWEKRARLLSSFDLTEKEVELFVEDAHLLFYLEGTAEKLSNDRALVRLATNYILSDLIALAGDFKNIGKIPDENFANLIIMLSKKELSSRAGKDILKIMFEEGGTPREIAEKNDLLQKSDEGSIETMLKAIIEANPAVVADYKSG
ncbi:MAG: Asp-tRNA(Asn)/Glu-tRNA(Gln) amidotransferase subunit GatB, partial [Candidatus Paceibacterota bacterium]